MNDRRFILRDMTSWRECLDYLMSLRDKNGRFEIRIKPWRKKRSTSANAYYWGVVVKALSDHTGYTPDEVHDEILMKYVGTETRTFNGHVREYPRRRTTSPETMETMDFQGLIETGQRISAEMGVILPDQFKEES